MSEKALPWKYWEESDFPKHDHHTFGGVDSDPDHCVGCCERTITYLLGKMEAKRTPSPEVQRVITAAKATLRFMEQTCAWDPVEDARWDKVSKELGEALGAVEGKEEADGR